MGGIIEDLLGIFRPKEKVPHKERITQKYNESVKADEITDPINETAAYVTSMIKDPTTNSEEILAATIESETPDGVFGAVVESIAQDPTIPNRTIAAAIDSSETKVPDKVILEILAGIPMGLSERRLLIKNIQNPKLRETTIIQVLTKFYKGDFRKHTDMDVVRRLEGLYSFFEFDNAKIDNLALKIIAKQMATMYHIYNGAAFPQRYKDIPPATLEKMMEADMPSLIESEYKSLYPEEEDRYKPEIVRTTILRELAPGIAKVYKKTGAFLIPRSDAMSKLTDEEIELFISEIFRKAGLNKKEEETEKEAEKEKERVAARIDIVQQIKAQYDVEEHAQREILLKLALLPKSYRILILTVFKAMLESDPDKMSATIQIIAANPSSAVDVIRKMGSTGALEDFMLIPPLDRTATFTTIGETVRKRFNRPDEDIVKEASAVEVKPEEPSVAGTKTEEASTVGTQPKEDKEPAL